ncbi:MAG: DUF2851 family protein [Bacteroidota bacterium]
MSEEFLHYIWQFQLFNKKELLTQNGDPINIISVGTLNRNSGPDFLNAEIILDGLKWHGHVEIHINEKDWYNHKHHEDGAYKNVILHVIWNSQEIETGIATLELQDHVSLSLLNRYENFISPSNEILCSSQIGSIDPIVIAGMQGKTLAQRLERKSNDIINLLKERKGDWEQTTFEILGRSFGFKINSDAFSTLCERIPYKIVRKIGQNIFQLEALFFGMSGLLEITEKEDAYKEKLRSEFLYLQKKYDLKVAIGAVEWKFLRLRPHNFPTVRLAQFSALLSFNDNLFSSLLNYNSSSNLLEIQASDYWHSHFKFGKKSESASGKLGIESQRNLKINTLAPLIFSYGLYYDNESYKEEAVMLLESITSEHNVIIKKWKKLGVKPKSASESQSLIELYNEFCLRKKCLSCTIGSGIIRQL